MHGTHAAETSWQLTSLTREGAGLGRLKPDVLVYDHGEPVVVADAKSKRLRSQWPERPQGHDRADLDQLTSYLARYSPQGQAQGFLLYPRDPEQEDVADAEARGPWQAKSKAKVRFTRLAIYPQDAVIELKDLLRGRARRTPRRDT